MPSDFSREQVAAIAALANLELDDAEVDLFARQLGAILSYAEEVQQADTAGIPPTAGVAAANAEREDEVMPSLSIDDVLANAPDPQRTLDDRDRRDGGFFRVPRVLG